MSLTVAEVELVNRWIGGDVAAGDEVCRHFWPMVWRFVRSKVRQQDLADDIAQEVFLRVLNRLDASGPLRAETFKSYLFKIAENLMLDYHRRSGREKRRVERLDDPLYGQEDDRTKGDVIPGPAPDPEQLSLHRELRIVLRNAIEKMAETRKQYYDVFMFAYGCGLRRDEIAKILDITYATANMDQFRSLKFLEGELQERGFRFVRCQNMEWKESLGSFVLEEFDEEVLIYERRAGEER